MRPPYTLVLPVLKVGQAEGSERKREMSFDYLEVPASTTGRCRRSGDIVSAQPPRSALPCLNSVAQEPELFIG